jgi:hypothetical protein
VTERAYTMRELLTKARERFGPAASRYKTRQELLEALELVSVGAPAASPPEPAPDLVQAEALVVRDFFVPARR